MKATRQKIYTAEDKYIVKFVDVDNVPGWNYKVFIYVKHDGKVKFIAKDWLGNDFRPSAKNASYYIEKHTQNLDLESLNAISNPSILLFN